MKQCAECARPASWTDGNFDPPRNYCEEHVVQDAKVRQFKQTTKPHEETWRIVYDRLEYETEDDAGIVADFVQEHANAMKPIETERMRLAAQAPAMARLLLTLEWDGLQYGDSEPSCPVCQAYTRDRKHTENCELATVLRAAGVLP